MCFSTIAPSIWSWLQALDNRIVNFFAKNVFLSLVFIDFWDFSDLEGKENSFSDLTVIMINANRFKMCGINQKCEFLFPLFRFPSNNKKVSEERRDDAYNFITLHLPRCFNIQRKTSKFFHYFDSTLIFICLPCTRVRWIGKGSEERLKKGYMMFLHTLVHRDTWGFSTESFSPDAIVGTKEEKVIESIVDELHFSRFISVFDTSIA